MTASLVVQTAFLGDVVLTTPLIAELAKRGTVDVVTTPLGAGMLANNPHIRSILPYDKHGDHSGISGLLGFASRLRRAKYDAAYLGQQSWRSAALALAAGIPARTGFAGAAGRFLYTNRVEYRRDIHHVARLLSLAGAETADAMPRLYPGIAERAAVDRLLALADVVGNEPLIALAPASVWATKRWPYYQDLARDITHHHARVVVVGSKDDAPLVAEVCEATGGSAINAAGQLSLLASAELIRRCKLLVTNDSAPQHLAAAVGTPTLTVFGPTVPALGFGPLAPQSATIGNDALTCRPCHAHGPQRCPLGHWQCMLNLAPGVVAARAVDILSAS